MQFCELNSGDKAIHKCLSKKAVIQSTSGMCRGCVGNRSLPFLARCGDTCVKQDTHPSTSV